MLLLSGCGSVSTAPPVDSTESAGDEKQTSHEYDPDSRTLYPDPAAELWIAVRNSEDPEAFEKFIAAFPNSPYVPAAQVKLNGLSSDSHMRLKSGSSRDLAATAVPDKPATDGSARAHENSDYSHLAGFSAVSARAFVDVVVKRGAEFSVSIHANAGNEIDGLELVRRGNQLVVGRMVNGRSACRNGSVAITDYNGRRSIEMDGCRSHIDSSCGTFAWKCHHVAGDDDLLTIGLGEQRPRLVEA